MTNQEKLWRVVQLAAELQPKITELYELMGIRPGAETFAGGGVVTAFPSEPKKERKKYTNQTEPSNDEIPENIEKKKKFPTKSCCGSNGPRHKSDCAGGTDRGVKTPTFGLMVLKCLGCGFCFKFKGEKMDAICPECRKTQVYPSATPPDNDTIYEPDQP